jgi:twitching motility protein PilJ
VDTIKIIQQETKNAVQSMQFATKEVDTGVNLSRQSDESLKQIVTSVESVVRLVKEISAATEQQGSTGENVSTSLQEVANKNNKTMEEVDRHLIATKELGVISQELRSMIRHFRIQDKNYKDNVIGMGGIDAAIHRVSSQQ